MVGSISCPPPPHAVMVRSFRHYIKILLRVPSRQFSSIHCSRLPFPWDKIQGLGGQLASLLDIWLIDLIQPATECCYNAREKILFFPRCFIRMAGHPCSMAISHMPRSSGKNRGTQCALLGEWNFESAYPHSPSM